MEPCRLGAREAAARIERGELTAQSLLQSCLERIEQREADVQVWAFIDRDLAFSRVDVVGKPLYGVPVGVKDIFDTFDMPTQYGSPIHAGHRPGADAACVALARDAGAVMLGKTVTTEFALRHPGPTTNPRGATRRA